MPSPPMCTAASFLVAATEATLESISSCHNPRPRICAGMCRHGGRRQLRIFARPESSSPCPAGHRCGSSSAPRQDGSALRQTIFPTPPPPLAGLLLFCRVPALLPGGSTHKMLPPHDRPDCAARLSPSRSNRPSPAFDKAAQDGHRTRLVRRCIHAPGRSPAASDPASLRSALQHRCVRTVPQLVPQTHGHAVCQSRTSDHLSRSARTVFPPLAQNECSIATPRSAGFHTLRR